MLVAVGRVLRPQGLRGELRVEILSDFPDRLEGVERLYVGEPPVERRLLGWRRQGSGWVVRLADCTDRGQAEALRGSLLLLPEEELRVLPPDRFYVFRLIGLRVLAEDGRELGRLADVESAPAHDLWMVRRPDGGTFAVPAVRAIVRRVDIPAGVIEIRPPQGLEDL